MNTRSDIEKLKIYLFLNLFKTELINKTTCVTSIGQDLTPNFPNPSPSNTNNKTHLLSCDQTYIQGVSKVSERR